MVIFFWAVNVKRKTFNGIKLNLQCEYCKSKKVLFNLYYDLRRVSFCGIPLGCWEIQDIFVQCIKCGNMDDLDEVNGKFYDEAEKLYWKLSSPSSR